MSEVPKIYSSISAIMGEIDAVGKNRKNAQQGYAYRGIDDVYLAVNAAMVKHGVFTVPKVLEMKREERQSKSGSAMFVSVLTMEYTFFAVDGSSISTVVIGEGMDSGDKASNKAMSVAQKYAFIQIFSIPTEDPKDPEIDSPEVKAKVVNEPPKPETPKAEPKPERAPLPGEYITPFGTLKGAQIKNISDDKIKRGIKWVEATEERLNQYGEWVKNAKLFLENSDMTLGA